MPIYTTNNEKSYTIENADEIHRGGEGKIMLLKNEKHKVAKLYHQNIPPLSEAQFSFLSQLDQSLFVVPIDLLWDSKKSIAGFTMAFVPNTFFPISSFFSKHFCTKNGITEKVKRKTAEKLITSVQYAHSQGVVIGDLNQYNILVNQHGDLKLIDTDSYQTNAHTHSGLLLDDIRDYLHGGQVSAESDFFALSIMIFYAFTHVHPFKGIHPKYKRISDRMIHKLPVFLGGEGIKIPKVYRPLADKKLTTQFDELYLKGKRFLMSISGVAQIQGKLAPVKITTIEEKDLTVTQILPETASIDIHFNQHLGYVETQDNFFVYDAKNKGYLSLKYTISKTKFDSIFLGNKNVVVAKGVDLFQYKSDADIVLIKNFKLAKNSFTHEFENILVIFEGDLMYKLYLDEIIASSIRNTRHEVFGASFSHHSGLLQNTGGIKRAFYKSGKDIAAVKIGFPAKAIRQHGSAACIQYIEKNKLITRYLFFNGLKTNDSPLACEQLTDFAYMPAGNSGFIFEPADDAIKVLRTQDFQMVSLLDCPQVSSLSKLQVANAGIIAIEDQKVFLLNRR